MPVLPFNRFNHDPSHNEFSQFPDPDVNDYDDDNGDDADDDADDDNGYPAYSHHDKFPPWWVFVCDDYGGNLSGDKIPP